MHELAPVIKDLAIMLGIAGIVVVLFQKISQPIILGYILAGVIIGPYTPPCSLVTDLTQIQTLSELGVIFLMFALGLDFSFHKLKQVGFSAVITGLLKVVTLTTVGWLIGWFLGWNFYDSLFLGGALAISSTVVIVKALEELNLKGKRFADLVFGILIVEDLLVVLMLTTLTTVVATKSILSLDMIIASCKLILVIGSWFLFGYFIVPMLFRKIINYVNQETLTIVSVALCLSLATIAAYFHYSTALGAFMMGSILAETPVAYRIKQLTEPLRDLFAALFFIAIGMLINIEIILKQWPIILAIALITGLCKILITSIGSFLTGQSIKTSLRAGFSMTPTGEFSFIIVSLGVALNVTHNSLYQTVIGVAAITILATPYLIKLSNKITVVLENKLSERGKYILESYSAWVYRALASYKKQLGYRKFIIRLALNGAIIPLIFSLTHDFALPEITQLIVNINLAESICWAITLLLSSPFIWGMLFSFKLINKNRQLPPLLLSIFLTLVELIILSTIYFHTWYIPLAAVIAIIIIFGSSYRQLENSYYWFEKRLTHLLRKRDQKQTKYEELAPWDTHLVELIVTNDAPGSLVGKTLSENHFRKKFGINVVAIRRGARVILAPRGSEKILFRDELIVLGNDEQIEHLKRIAEDQNFSSKRTEILNQFVLFAVLLEANDHLIGKSIRDSNIRQQSDGIVVGLERNGFRILNPDPATILKTNDLLLVVGIAEKISANNEEERKELPESINL